MNSRLRTKTFSWGRQRRMSFIYWVFLSGEKYNDSEWGSKCWKRINCERRRGVPHAFLSPQSAAKMIIIIKGLSTFPTGGGKVYFNTF